MKTKTRSTHVPLTAGKKKRMEQNRKRIERLAEHWPRFAYKKGAAPLPMSLGMYEDVAADAQQRGIAISESQIRQGLMLFSKRPAYLKAIAKGGDRFDLNGKTKGEVTAQEQEMARAEIARRNEAYQARGEKKNTHTPPKVD